MIFRDNVKIGVICMKWGLGLSILDIPLTRVSNYLTSLYMAAPVMMGKPALLPGLFHVPVEFMAFGCAVGSGLKITSIIFDIAESFLIERKDLKKDIKELLLLIALTLFLFAMAALIEEGITPELFRPAY